MAGCELSSPGQTHHLMSWQTRFPSIQLGTNANAENPNPEAGYSPVLKANLAWSDANTPLPLETDPLRAFNRLFEGIAVGSSPTPDTNTTDQLQAKDAPQ